jgi:hypothetical protein
MAIIARLAAAEVRADGPILFQFPKPWTVVLDEMGPVSVTAAPAACAAAAVLPYWIMVRLSTLGALQEP